jgi:hypothetical protein
MQEPSKRKGKGLLAFQIISIYKLSFEVIFWIEEPEIQISFEVLVTKHYLPV